jgi:hypothetical protein
MKKIQYIQLLWLFLAVFLIGLFHCSLPEPPEKPRLIAASASDFIVFPYDTVQLSVEPIFAPALITDYVWSYGEGEKHFDTIKTNSRKKTWNIADSGVHTIAVKVIDSRGVASDSIVFHVTVTLCKPEISIMADTLGDFNTASVFSIINSSGCKHILHYLLSFNGGQTFSDTTKNDLFVKQWKKEDTGKTIDVIVRAEVVTGYFSDPASLKIHVAYCRPFITLSGDNVGYPYDSTRFNIITSTPCQISRYLWSFNNGIFFTDSTFVPSFIKRWQLQDTGTCLVLAAARTTSGILSIIDSFRILIHPNIFSVTLPPDTSIRANDTIRITSKATSDHSKISYFLWSIDNSSQLTKTTQEVLAYSWPYSQAGVHKITVRCVDINDQFSASDSMNILVLKALTPSLSVPRDTLVRAMDTINATVSATVAHGTIKRYFWNIGALSWTDSTTLPQRKIWRQGKDTVSVFVGALDEQGNIGIDSFHIYFNSPPALLQMLSPKKNDSISLRTIDSTFSRGIIPFKFSATDKNGNSDTLMYYLYLGKSQIPDSLHKIYEGHDTAFLYSKIDTTPYYWRLVVKDRIGDSSETQGAFICFLQQTICFAGHSIIAGTGGIPDSGGIRKKILSTLRSRKGGNAARVKSVGPLTTGNLMPQSDDSCFAVSSYRARDLWLLMKNAFPLLNADIWVVMLGVNDSYTYNNEFRQLLWIIDTINVHNPQASTYVINGLPYELVTGQDVSFNKWLSDSIIARQKLQRKIWDIDAYKVFAVNDTPNPVLFYSTEHPYLHPNQKGYDTLAGMILDTMFKAP